MFFVLILNDDDDGGSGRGTNFPILMVPEAVLLLSSLLCSDSINWLPGSDGSWETHSLVVWCVEGGWRGGGL